MNPKQRAAEAALAHVQSGMVVGLGTGSTADLFIRALATALAEGRLREIRGIPTSVQSERRARELGVPLAMLSATVRPDVTIDGADEIAPNLDLIKGLGGALLREKIVAQNSAKLIIIADAGKTVSALGTKSPLPVEVVPFCHEAHEAFLKSLGATPVLRRDPAKKPVVTDNGNYIYDCRFSRIDKPRDVESELLHRAGVVETGLFLGMATLAIIGDDGGVRELTR